MFDDKPASLALVSDVSADSEIERRYRTLVEMSGDGLAVYAADGVLRFMNAAGERMLGLTPGELLGKEPVSLLHPDDAAKAGPPAPGGLRTQIVRTRHKNGSYLSVESTVTNLTLDPAIRGFVSHVPRRHRAPSRPSASCARPRAGSNICCRRPRPSRTRRVRTAISAPRTSARTFAEVLGWDATAFSDNGRFWRVARPPRGSRARARPVSRSCSSTAVTSCATGSSTSDGSYRWILDSARLRRGRQARARSSATSSTSPSARGPSSRSRAPRRASAA